MYLHDVVIHEGEHGVQNFLPLSSRLRATRLRDRRARGDLLDKFGLETETSHRLSDEGCREGYDLTLGDFPRHIIESIASPLRSFV